MADRRWKLKRTRQCESCPWKVSTNPARDIPGYCEKSHRHLAGTIAEPAALRSAAQCAPAMTCHKHAPTDEAHCIGWLMNQLGTGNNIGLRIAVMTCENIGRVQLDGPQHERFEDTLP